MPLRYEKSLREPEIKAALIDRLFSEGLIADDAVVVSEMPVAGQSRRADLVLANGRLIGFEIKSDGDKTDRLQGQIDAYRKAFESIVVVTGPRHLDEVVATTPDCVGIFVLVEDGSDALGARLVRWPQLNRMGTERAIRQMRADELFRLARSFGAVSASVRDRASLERIVRELPAGAVRKAALSAIKSRYRAPFEAFMRIRNSEGSTLKALSHLRRPPWNARSVSSVPRWAESEVDPGAGGSDLAALALSVRPRRLS